MARIFVGVRGVDADVYRAFRAMAVERGIRLGEAITRAMKRFLTPRSTSEGRKGRLHYLDEVAPFSFGEASENTSGESS